MSEKNSTEFQMSKKIGPIDFLAGALGISWTGEVAREAKGLAVSE